jgi:hypothetical protein
MADSAVNLGAGGFTDFSSMSMDEALYGTNDPVEISRRTRPSYSETGEAYYFVDDQARPFIDEEGYRVDLGSDARSRGMAGQYFEQSVPRYSPYEGMAEPLTRQSTPDFSSRPTDLRGYKGAPELYMQDGGEPTREEAFLQAEASKRESALQLLNSLSEDELVQQFGVEGYQRLLADAGIFDFNGFQIQPQIDARFSETGSTQDLGPFNLARTQQQGRGRLGFAANVEDFGTFGAGVSGGFSKGEVEYPDELRRMGAPDKIKYGSGKLAPQSYDAFYQFPRGGPRITGQYMPSETGEDQYGVNIGYTIPFENGGNPAIEEAGILSALWNAPNAEAQNLVRTSGREGSVGSQTYYPEGTPTFEQMLEQKYGYPEVTREMSDAPESVRNQRPRHDMPTFQELEDARAHALMSAEMAKKFGPETATKLGNFAEGIDALPIPLIGNATPEDVAMDKRNNAFGVKLLREAGVNATPQQLARMVDSKLFEQLDQILGREPGSRSFKSPEGGLDVYFPRNEQGFFQTSRSGYY